jgi:hypothetical protein
MGMVVDRQNPYFWEWYEEAVDAACQAQYEEEMYRRYEDEMIASVCDAFYSLYEEEMCPQPKDAMIEDVFGELDGEPGFCPWV